jgi:hypothetical protein
MLDLARLLFFVTAQVASPVPVGAGSPGPSQPAGQIAPSPVVAPEDDAWSPYRPAPGPNGVPGTPPPPPPPFREPRLYGDQGTPELAVGLGYSSSTGFLAAGGFRYFVLDAVAPGIEGTYVSGGAGGAAYGLALASLRFVPLRTPTFALELTARGGRVFLSDHADGWGLGGELGVIVMLGAGAGLEVGYEALRLLPARFCADLSACVLQGPVLGLRLIL